MSQSSQHQGAQFESLFHELLERVLRVDLGRDVLQNSVQSSGVQYGKDIQTKWREPDGLQCFWHFECKSHRDGVLHQREVVDKVVDVYRSAHQVSVWCLALANIEPGVWIDEVFAWADEHLNLPIVLLVLSPQRGFIKQLFSCHPDLYEQLYPGQPLQRPDPETRRRTLELFSVLLRTETERAQRRALRPHGEWQIVAPKHFEKQPEPVAQRRAYLRGLTPTCPWEGLVFGWTISRASVEDPIVARVLASKPGFDYLCLVGAGGEGKSTALKRVAWKVATSSPEWMVIWVDALAVQQPATLPVPWIESLSDGANVLVCVDGSQQVRRIENGLEASWRLQAANKRLFVLMADRGNDWMSSPTRVALLRARSRPDEHKHMLKPLLQAEQSAIVHLLARNGLLHGKTIHDAVSRLTTASDAVKKVPDQPYLLPTLLQLTDPADRGFEAVLESVISDLGQLADRSSYKLLLATAIGHGAKLGLPRSLAEQLVGTQDQLANALSTLETELDRIWGGPSPLARSLSGDRYFVHHAVVADSLVSVAFASAVHREALLGVCDQLPRAVRPYLDADLRMPVELYAFLDGVPRYLDDSMHFYEGAERFLTAWLTLDSRVFPTEHRLAETCVRWLQHDLRQSPPDDLRVDELTDKARRAYQRSIEVARDVLQGPERPPWFAHYSFREHEVKALTGWSALEGTLAERCRDQTRRGQLLLRSGLLSLLSIDHSVRRANATATGSLALQLIRLGEFQLAARTTAASIQFGNASHIVNRQRKLLKDAGISMPIGGAELLGHVVASLCTGRFLAEWQEIGLFPSKVAHIEALLSVLARTTESIPTSTAISEARAALTALLDRETATTNSLDRATGNSLGQDDG